MKRMNFLSRRTGQNFSPKWLTSRYCLVFWRTFQLRFDCSCIHFWSNPRVMAIFLADDGAAEGFTTCPLCWPAWWEWLMLPPLGVWWMGVCRLCTLAVLRSLEICRGCGGGMILAVPLAWLLVWGCSEFDDGAGDFSAWQSVDPYIDDQNPFSFGGSPSKGMLLDDWWAWVLLGDMAVSTSLVSPALDSATERFGSQKPKCKLTSLLSVGWYYNLEDLPLSDSTFSECTILLGSPLLWCGRLLSTLLMIYETL